MRRSSERKTAVLQIRTTEEMIKKFKRFKVDGGFKTYHAALKELLDRCAKLRGTRFL